jgi:putative FmdB family regulatory protein
MPLYEYRCHKCGKVFEVIQKFSDVPLAVHEDCGGEVERLLSAPPAVGPGVPPEG